MKKILLSSVLAMGLVSAVSADVTVKSKAGTLKFNGVHYIGFTKLSDKLDSTKDYTRFEGRRNYLQVKAYFNEDPKSYLRVTLDSTASDGDIRTRIKYAYLYLNNVLPNTGVEIGQAHRPWIDYEEHNGWLNRSISKVFVEDHEGAHLTNSADRGINFKTKTCNFSSELGVFNGEGYHSSQKGTGLSAEWRLTWHAFGTGKVHHPKKYLNLSFFGQNNAKFKGRKDATGADVDLKWSGIHAVYANHNFLLAGQYIKVTDGNYFDGGNKYVEGKGYSVNADLKVAPKVSLIARYDQFKFDKTNTKNKQTLGGIAYKYNKNVKFLANIKKVVVSPETGADTTDKTYAMLTAEVKW